MHLVILTVICLVALRYFPKTSLALVLLVGAFLLNQPKYEPIIVPAQDMKPEKEFDVDAFLRAPFIIYPGDPRYEEARRKQQAEKKVDPTADGPVVIKPLPGTARKVY